MRWPGCTVRGAVIQQISFRGEQLAEVIGFYQRLRTRGTEIDMVVSHGNAIGMYFSDRPVDALLAELHASVDVHGADGFVDPAFVAAQGPR